jgi:hypothetical protein
LKKTALSAQELLAKQRYSVCVTRLRVVVFQRVYVLILLRLSLPVMFLLWLLLLVLPCSVSVSVSDSEHAANVTRIAAVTKIAESLFFMM